MHDTRAMWCGDDVSDEAPYSSIGTATTIAKDDDYTPPVARPIGFIWPEVKD